MTPYVASLWSYEGRSRERDRHSVTRCPDGSLEMRCGLSALRDEMVARTTRSSSVQTVGQTAARLIQLHAGRVSIDDMARSHGLSRQQFQ